MEHNENTRSSAAQNQDAPSKSARRRDALQVLQLASDLAALKHSALRQLPLSPDTLEAISGINHIKARVARKRQLHYAAKRLRHEDLDAIRAALEDPGDNEALRIRLAQWSQHLLRYGLPAVEQLMALVPSSNRQTLRQAVLAAQRLPAKDDELQTTAARNQLILRALRQQPDHRDLPPTPVAPAE